MGRSGRTPRAATAPARADHRPQPRAHHPRAEARAAVGGRYTVRVLEPSPPAIAAPPFHADDPCARACDDERLVVSPVGTGDLGYAQLIAERDDPAFTTFCRQRWLGAYPQLAPRPPTWSRIVAEHRVLAAQVLAPWRARALAVPEARRLRITCGGFGTPFVPGERQLRLDQGVLVLQRAGEADGFVPDTVAEAAEVVGLAAPASDPTRLDRDERLVLDPAGCRSLADWLWFATLVLEMLRARTGGRWPVLIDPDHLDVVARIGDAEVRASSDPPGFLDAGGRRLLEHEALEGRDDHVDTALDVLLAALGAPGPPARW